MRYIATLILLFGLSIGTGSLLLAIQGSEGTGPPALRSRDLTPTPTATPTITPTPTATSTPVYVTRGDVQGVGGMAMDDDDYYTTGQVLHSPAGEMAFTGSHLTPVPTPAGETTLRIVFRMSRPGPDGTPTPASGYAHVSRHGGHWLRADTINGTSTRYSTYFLATPTPTPTVGAGTPTPTPCPITYPYKYLLWTK